MFRTWTRLCFLLMLPTVAAAQDLSPPPMVDAPAAPAKASEESEWAAAPAAPTPSQPVPTSTAPVTTPSPALSSTPNVVSIAPLSLLGLYVAMEFERATSHDMSVFLAPQFQVPTTTNLAFTGLGSGSLSTWGILMDGGVRFFPFATADKPAPEGFWLAGVVGSGYQAATSGGTTLRGVLGRGYGMVGYTAIPGRVVLSFGIGGGAHFGHIIPSLVGGTPERLGLMPMLNVRASVGFAF